ncbi:hypothetical protein Poli38472_008803 [Pythium oligandrum]|uniref:Protein kinase domain-containing protein n=1 Tax=Pythium oligandrum TaxID=41045 RepID=A0A8K1C490_PYTOL|nr:hypothetical protein Poli38472_008803 [Pythium oligandrum]|eukprot:TMW56155.1 hypothetical protein Poli38472_008803 [Pythium oligandrum]
MEAPSFQPKPVKRQIVEEAPDIWMEALKDGRVEVRPRDTKSLRDYLKRELRVKIPITERLAQKVSAQDTEDTCTSVFTKLFQSHQAISAHTAMVLHSAIHPTTCGFDFAPKATYHHFWDSLIGVVLRLVSNGFYRRHRDVPGLFCPDFVFYYAGKRVCVFRGQEEGSGEMDVPIRKMSENMVWRHDDAPYLFGYIAVRYQVCLVVIRKGEDACRPTVEVLEQYDLGKVCGRLSFLLALLNMSTLFRSVDEQIRYANIREHDVTVQPNGVTIRCGKDSVLQEYPPDLPSESIIKNLKKLHTLMAKQSVPNVVCLAKANTKERHVVLRPLGLSLHPSDLKQLLMALRDVLNALVTLHSIGIMHRNLRWENVLKHPDDCDKWFLTNFDDAVLVPAAQGVQHLSDDSHAPEVDSEHAVEVDIWGVGHLLRTTNVTNIPSELVVMQAECLSEKPRSRPTATLLLKQVEAMLTPGLHET